MVILNPSSPTFRTIENIAFRILIVLYIIVAHFAKIIFFFSGLKMQYVNDEPWPYKQMFRTWLEGA